MDASLVEILSWMEPRALLPALATQVAFWCGLGRWLHADLARLVASARLGAGTAPWLAAATAAAGSAMLVWKRQAVWEPATARALRRAGATVRRPDS